MSLTTFIITLRTLELYYFARTVNIKNNNAKQIYAHCSDVQ